MFLVKFLKFAAGRAAAATLLTVLAFAGPSVAFENAKVLPKGVRNLNVRSVSTEFDEKSGPDGARNPLAQPLMQDLTFKRIAQGEEKLKADQLRAFLTSNGFSEDDSVGEFTADLNGNISVFAPIFSYGVSDRLTLAIAAPVYDAATSVSVGFQPNENAAAFLAALARPENNQKVAAREAADKLNAAVARLNTKLTDNHYAALDDWNGQGLGDVTIAGKYRFYGSQRLGAALTSGVVAPTGRTDDPDLLTDIPFGDGQWDIFGQLSVDEELVPGLVLNQFGKYTVQLPDDKNVRAVNEDEAIEVNYTESRFKLGDKVDAGTSVQWTPAFGLVTGIGYTYFRKYADLYREVEAETRTVIEKDTEQLAHNGEAQIGYSTVPLYQAGKFAVPFELKLTYVRQIESRNMPVTDLAQFDLNLFF